MHPTAVRFPPSYRWSIIRSATRIQAWPGLLILATLAALPFHVRGADSAYLFLKLNGQDVKGETQQTTLGRADSIEALRYEQSIVAGPGSARGGSIVIQKRIDRSSPLLIQGMLNRQVAEGVFKFFRPNPVGDGTTQQFYTVSFKDGRIAAVKQSLPDCLDQAASKYPLMEEVTFAGGSVQWTYTDGGITAETKPEGAAPAGQSKSGGLGEKRTRAAEEPAATQPADGAEVAFGQWCYTGDTKIALNVQSLQPATTWSGGGGLEANTGLMRANISFRNDGSGSWTYLNRSTIKLVLLDANGQTIGGETHLYYVATAETDGAYEILKNQRLNFVFDVAYSANAHPAELMVQGFSTSLRYKIAAN